jgi:2'-5' RNA ligase
MTPLQKRQLELMRQMEAAAASGSATSTFVDMQQDYANDPQLCLTIVTYLSPKLQQTIYEKLVKPLRAVEPDFYYFPQETLHITVQNIRTVADPPTYTPHDVATAQTLLREFTARHGSPFRFHLTGVLAFPTSVAVAALIEPAYDAFVKNLRNELVRKGIPDDKKYFTDEMVFANTTFCRYTHAPSSEFLQTVGQLKGMDLGEFTAREVCLITTNAGCHPSKTVSLAVKPLG